MTSPYLIADLQRDEGLRLEAYPDPLSGGAPWTIGYGHTGPEVHPGLVWSQADAANALAADVAAVKRGLYTALPWWTDLDPIRQDCLVNMAFNLGVAGLLEFTTFLAFVKAGDFARAADDLSTTLWAGQVPARCQRVEREIATGEHAA